VVLGGSDNRAEGVNSIVMGKKATAKADFSAAINLSGGSAKAKTDGEVLIRAQSFVFRLGKEDNEIITITETNIQKLIDILKGRNRRRLQRQEIRQDRATVLQLRGGAASTIQEEEEEELLERLHEEYENQEQLIDDQQNDKDDLENEIEDIREKLEELN